MAKFKPIKKTSFLEAVAATIQHEKEVFEFYNRHAESLPEGPVRVLFQQLAGDMDEHLHMIQEIYSKVNNGQTLPNLKMASEVHKFHSTSLQILMRRLDRNTAKSAGSDEIEALTLATREHEDAAEFYTRMTNKFDDPGVKYLFQRLAHFQDENRILLESYMTYSAQATSGSLPNYYWEDDNLTEEAQT